MIVVRITMNVLPEKQKEVVQTLLSMIGSMGKKIGCLGYSLMCDMNDKNQLCVLAEWENRNKLEQYLKSDMFGVLLGTKSLLCQPHGIHIYTIEKAEGMDAVRAARGNRNNGA